MRVGNLVLFPVLAAASLWGQADSAPAPIAQSTPQPAAAETQNRVQPPMDLTAMRIQQSHKMSAELEAMKLKLDEIKANAATAKDPVLKKQLELDAELWDMTLTHLNEMTMTMLQMQRPQMDFNRAAQMRRQMLEQRKAMGTGMAAPQPPMQPVPGVTTPTPAAAPQAATPAPASSRQ